MVKKKVRKRPEDGGQSILLEGIEGMQHAAESAQTDSELATLDETPVAQDGKTSDDAGQDAPEDPATRKRVKKLPRTKDGQSSEGGDDFVVTESDAIVNGPQGQDAQTAAAQAYLQNSEMARMERVIKNYEDEITFLKNDIAKKNDIMDEYRRLLDSTRADFDSFKSRSRDEAQNVKKYACEPMVKDLLHVSDNIQLAIKNTNPDTPAKDLMQGLELIVKQMDAMLAKHGVEPIQTVGRPFDPRFHEAVSREDVSSVPENTIITETTKGFMLYDRVLRAAKVVVSSGGKDAASPPQHTQGEESAVKIIRPHVKKNVTTLKIVKMSTRKLKIKEE